jgi:monovalent cation:H+ antiporter-2, CPA2 family
MLDNILLLLLVSVLTALLLHRFRLPAMLGYLCVGILLGPHALGWVADLEGIQESAEWGVVFLMFMIGLEFSLKQLLSMKNTVFIYGGASVLITILLTISISWLYPISLAETIVLGSIIAMSSTAIVIKQLNDQLELNVRHGVDALSILLFQDLAVIPLLILIPTLHQSAGFAVLPQLGLALGKACIALTLMLSLGRWALGPIFYKISKVQSAELFTLAALFVTLGSAWLTYKLGLSLALGAFLSGIMLGETPFRHQIESDIRPFRDLLLGLFFISIGMQFKVSLLWTNWPELLCLLVILILAKYLIITVIGLLLKQRNWETASRTALCLAHGGEFGFALLSLAIIYHIVPAEHEQWILGTLILSMAIAPLMVAYNAPITHTFMHFLLRRRHTIPHEQMVPVLGLTRGLQNHVVLCGYGRVGQLMADCLHMANIPYIALDSDVEKVKAAYQAGKKVYYANARDHRILKKVHLKRARALVITFSNQETALTILEQVRQHYPDLPIIARAYNEQDALLFHEKGATEIVPEVLEAGLTLTRYTLECMNIDSQQIEHYLNHAKTKYSDPFRKKSRRKS